MKLISTKKMPIVKGHYTPVVEHNGFLFVSGQIPTSPESGEVPEGIEKQTKLVFTKLELLLNESGSSLDKLLQVRIYLTDIDNWDVVNTIYASLLGPHKPARCVVPVSALHYGCLIEVEAVAFV
jgi:reactive intermediate/imine deaminase